MLAEAALLVFKAEPAVAVGEETASGWALLCAFQIPRCWAVLGEDRIGVDAVVFIIGCALLLGG